MANDFKRICTPNISNSSNTTIYGVPAGSSSSALESIVIVFIVKNASIPAGASLEVMSGNKLVLQNDGTNADNLEALASAASSVDITVSVLEDV